MAKEQDQQDQKPLEPVPGLPTLTVEEMRAEIRKKFPTLTDEEIDLYL